MKILTIAAIVCAIAAPAAAEQLTVGDCLKIRAGLSALDKYTATGKDDKPVDRFYKFGGELRFKIAQTISMLTPFVESSDRARLALVGQVAGGKKIEESSPELIKLNEEYQKVLDQPCGVEISKIKLGELKLGDEDGLNPIPPSVLSLIMPIIEVATPPK